MSGVEAVAPFVKWVGGKRRLLPSLLERVPAKFGAYHEPFVGGGALFFARRHYPAFLSDTNPELIAAYVALRDNVEGVIALLSTWPRDRDFYMKVRASQASGVARSDVERAARFIYLMKCGFNGIWRTNAKGEFNVPFGGPARVANRAKNDPPICDAPALRACARALADVSILAVDFGAADRAKAGDFVYFDPPYVPISATSSFTRYGADGFGRKDHERLRDLAVALVERGVHVLLSNSGAPLVRELYASSLFTVDEVKVRRSVAASGDARAEVTEVLIASEGCRAAAVAAE